MKCVPVHHGIPAVLHRDEPWLHRHSENGALSYVSLSSYLVVRNFITIILDAHEIVINLLIISSTSCSCLKLLTVSGFFLNILLQNFIMTL